MQKISFLFILATLLFSACESGSLDEKMLIGQWKGADWNVKTNETYENGDPKPDKKRDVSSLSFEFKADQTYTANYGTQKEAGTYYLNGYKLYTTEHGKAEKNVALKKLTPDTLIMNMNRTGTIERLTLVKK